MAGKRKAASPSEGGYAEEEELTVVVLPHKPRRTEHLSTAAQVAHAAQHTAVVQATSAVSAMAQAQSFALVPATAQATSGASGRRPRNAAGRTPLPSRAPRPGTAPLPVVASAPVPAPPAASTPSLPIGPPVVPSVLPAAVPTTVPLAVQIGVPQLPQRQAAGAIQSPNSGYMSGPFAYVPPSSGSYSPTLQTWRGPGVKWLTKKGNPPLSVSDEDWDRAYNAADSRVRGRHGSSHRESYRDSGETRAWAIVALIVQEKLQPNYIDDNP